MKLISALLCLLPLTLLFWESEQQLGSKTGPYIMEVDQVFLCEDQGTNKANINISLYLGKQDSRSKTRTHLHRGSFSFPFTEDDVTGLGIIANVYQKKTNDWLLMYHYDENMCDSIATLAAEIFTSLRKAIGVSGEGCQLPMGNYTFNDWEAVFALPSPVLEYGTYRLVIEFIEDKQVYGCVTIVLLIKRKY